MIPIILIILGFILLISGSKFLINGASNIAKIFHVSEFIIGLTIVSIGTSMPELFIGIQSVMENKFDIAIGNVIGSNICNILLILGISSIIKEIRFNRTTRKIEIPMCIMATTLVFLFCLTSNIISSAEALVLLMLFVLFIIYTIMIAKKDRANHEDKSHEKVKIIGIIFDLFLVALGIVFLKYGGDLVVDNATIIAKQLKISEKIISLTVLAIGTSLPEIVTTVVSVIKGKNNIAIGNIIGSVIMNLLLILGLSAMINPITYNSSFDLEFLILMVSTIFLYSFSIIKPKNIMTRNNGITFIILFIIYIMILLFI